MIKTGTDEDVPAVKVVAPDMSDGMLVRPPCTIASRNVPAVVAYWLMFQNTPAWDWCAYCGVPDCDLTRHAAQYACPASTSTVVVKDRATGPVTFVACTRSPVEDKRLPEPS